MEFLPLTTCKFLLPFSLSLSLRQRQRGMEWKASAFHSPPPHPHPSTHFPSCLSRYSASLFFDSAGIFIILYILVICSSASSSSFLLLNSMRSLMQAASGMLIRDSGLALPLPPSSFLPHRLPPKSLSPCCLLHAGISGTNLVMHNSIHERLASAETALLTFSLFLLFFLFLCHLSFSMYARDVIWMSKRKRGGEKERKKGKKNPTEQRTELQRRSFHMKNSSFSGSFCPFSAIQRKKR